MDFDLVIRGGRIITSESSATGDIGINEGKITAIATSLGEMDGSRVIDARGLLVAPGAIDVHTHFDTNLGERSTADDYESGSRAAAAGGITSFINMAFQRRGETLRQTVRAEVAKADGKTHLDYGVHVVVTDLDPSGVLDEIGALADEGFSSLKLFTTIDDFKLTDEQILLVMARAARDHVIVNVHAEDDGLISHLTHELITQGKTSVAHLYESRPPEAEALATARVAAYARVVGAAVYFVHLSCGLALDAVRQARSAGGQVFVETRPAYLYLDRSRYELPGQEGNKYVAWPPLREWSDQKALWEGLRNGEIQTYATDHTTWTAAQKMDPRLTFAEIPGGVSNVQTSIGMLYAEGVRKGRISENQFVALCATNPAKLFGLWPAKGTLGVGSDADIMLIDPNRRFRVASTAMESRSDFDPYEGYEAIGWPSTVIAGGDVIVDNGRVCSRPGRGSLLRRARYRSL
ncbi:MAG TPA: dihydropyrimidinase [Candidatus Dormibacteraeota bacterium]|nr:dihydropyrimidinase [Candidatus Dormibacteraeota bacterium]